MRNESEIKFFCKILEKFKIKSEIITESHVPENIDFGLRMLLGLTKDYNDLFNINILNFTKNEITKIEDIFSSNYIFIPLPCQEEKTALVLGPYTKSIITSNDITQKCEYYSLNSSIASQIIKYFSTVTYIADEYVLVALVNSLGEILFDSLENFSVINKELQEKTDINLFPKIKAPEKTEAPLLSIRLMEQRYKAENDLIAAVSQGLFHKASMVFGSISPSGALEVRTSDNLRNMKNYLIICNTLLRKAAEQGSVHPIYIDSISSEFALKIEEIQNAKDFDEMFNYMIQKYCRLVNKYSQKGYSLLIQKVITQIDADITADLSLKNISEIQKINPSYLSTLFKKETGETLTEYVNRKRIERAKQLLKASNLQIQTVAQNCGVLDVNYFTKIFKKHTGKTPRQFREELR